MNREDIRDCIPIEVDRCLDAWSRFMHRGRFCKGYPSRSAGFAGSGIGCWDDLEEEWASALATEVNTVMDDLDNKHYIAISNFYCSRKWKFISDEVEFLLNATDAFEKKARARGVL